MKGWGFITTENTDQAALHLAYSYMGTFGRIQILAA